MCWAYFKVNFGEVLCMAEELFYKFILLLQAYFAGDKWIFTILERNEFLQQYINPCIFAT